MRRGAAGVLVVGVLLLVPTSLRPFRFTERAVAATEKAERVSNPVDLDRIIPPPCPLCAKDDLGVPIHVLSVEEVDAVGKAYSDTNIVRITLVDSLLQAGTFGPPKSDKARHQAHMLVRMLTLNAYSYMIRFGTDPNTVWQSNEASMAPAFASFSDPGIVPLAHLTQARMGLGHMCARYDLSQKMRTETILGGRHLTVRIDDVNIQGRMVRVLIMDLPTSLHDVVEVWLTEHVSMDVTHPVVDGPPAPYESYVIGNMQGLWVHKGGIHRPDAFVFWVTPRTTLGPKLPRLPLVGARIYVPHLRLRLPSIIPDFTFEDLREVDLPQPVLSLDYLTDHRYPGWLEPAYMRGFKGWEGAGPLPPGLRKQFPDLK